MGEPLDIRTRIHQASARFGGQYKKVGPAEAAGPCPFCGGRDRFRIFADNGYWCRQCGAAGWLDENESKPLTAEELADMRLRALEASREDHERRLSALEQMAAQMALVDEYHGNLWDSEAARAYWESEGVSYDSIRRFQLGYCHRCPLAPSPSYTIPIINSGKLRNIRHRLQHDVGGGKYRPHMAGLPTTLYNADELKSAPGYIIIAEGEKKVIQLAQQGFSAVGIFGKNGFKAEWAKYFRQQRVYVCLDPDAVDTAAEVGALFNGRGYVVELPVKADDFFVRYGGDRREMQDHLDMARRA